jgi:hypothetical protein
MSKRLLVALAILAFGSQAVADVGIFEFNHDVGNTNGIGYALAQSVGGGAGIEYVITGSGNDIWGNTDGMHMAYNLVEGDVRLSGDFDWIVNQTNTWSKYGMMLRDPGADVTYHGNANFANLSRRDENLIQFQGRSATDEGSWTVGKFDPSDVKETTIGIQRINSGGFTVIQGLIDYGSGWELVGTTVNSNLAGQVMAGPVVTSHNNNLLAQVRVRNVSYEFEDIGLLNVPTVDTDPIDQCGDVPGFQIRVMKRDMANEWGFQGASDLLAGITSSGILDDELNALHTGIGGPLPGWNPTVGTRVAPVVNLNQDNSDSGAFGDDLHFPGVDYIAEKFVWDNLADSDNDDDNDFATEVIACIYLTEGLHMLGANSDDGTIIEVGGVEVGRTGEWKGASNVDFLFEVATEGFYSFRAQMHEGGGGGSLELHEVLADGTRILLGATDEAGGFIGSPVYAPEPATIALLGLGGLSLLRRKRS